MGDADWITACEAECWEFKTGNDVHAADVLNALAQLLVRLDESIKQQSKTDLTGVCSPVSDTPCGAPMSDESKTAAGLLDKYFAENESAACPI